ncbi:MAG: hypothetical protein IKA02_05830, partial [Clostridia bacterium]|nr:hypothetical protein [Clostridia bacterium]
MKRVLAIILCLLCTLFILVACGDNSADTDNTDKGHVHTFKTNEDWSKDSKNHWYEATCDCEDVTVTKLNHTDANNDGACDVCKFVIDGHEHEYSEEWTADCTNHWNSASCGHTVAGINVGAHTPGEDGKCTVCKYTVEDLHQHIYDTNWTYGDNYHWHAALCEHKSEITDKSACTVNDAGMCTVCNTVIKPIDKTDILAILKAAVANNFKVVSGNVYATEQAYEGKTVESGKSEEIFYVLGNGASYIKLVSYDKNDKFGGTDQYWFQLLENGDIFGVQMPYTHPNEEKRNTSLQLFPVSGDIDKLSGYTYIPGGILAKYEDNTTLAQTIFDLYDIMTLGTNVINATSSYNEKTGEYTFSYDYFTVNETKGNTAQDGSGEEIISYYVEYFKVSVLFTVNSDYVINFAEFDIKSYRGLEDVDEDLTYDPETNTVTLLDGADPTVYGYSVSQTSGERVHTSIYTKESLLPIDFDLSYVTGVEHSSNGTTITSEEPIVDTDGDGIIDLVIDKATFVRLHLGSLKPKSANANFMDTSDLNVTYVNVEGYGVPWGKPENFQAPGFDPFTNCITFRTQDSGTYLITIKFGQVEKKITLVIPGEPVVTAPEDTADTKYVIVTETM